MGKDIILQKSPPCRPVSTFSSVKCAESAESSCPFYSRLIKKRTVFVRNKFKTDVVFKPYSPAKILSMVQVERVWFYKVMLDNGPYESFWTKDIL